MDYGRRCIGSQSKVVSSVTLVNATEVSDVLDNLIKPWEYYYFWRFSVLVERFMLLMGMKFDYRFTGSYRIATGS